MTPCLVPFYRAGQVSQAANSLLGFGNSSGDLLTYTPLLAGVLGNRHSRPDNAFSGDYNVVPNGRTGDQKTVRFQCYVAQQNGIRRQKTMVVSTL